jgi:hypothetical protein
MLGFSMEGAQMKVQLIAMLSVASLALMVGCGDDDGGSGGSSSGGSGGSAGGSGGSGGSTGGSAGGMGGTGGAACQSCSEFTNDANPDSDNLCPASATLWEDLLTCICENVCTDECMTTTCATPSVSPDATCQTCLDDTGGILAGCGAEASACLGDT